MLMKTTKILLISFFLFYFLFYFMKASFAVPVVVDIDDKIEGNPVIVEKNWSFNNKIYEIDTLWENIGSTSCKVYSVLDVFEKNQTKPKRFWSNVQYAHPGVSIRLKNYLYFRSNTSYEIKHYIFYCKKMELINTYNITTSEDNLINTSTLEGVSIDIKPVDENRFTYNIRAINESSYSGSLLLLPLKSPSYWIIENKIIDFSGPDKEVKGEIYYDPELWYEQRLEFLVIDQDGNAKTVITTNKFEKQDLFDMIRKYAVYIIILVSLLILYPLYLIFLRVYKFISERIEVE